jgi:hypothetical protein
VSTLGTQPPELKKEADGSLNKGVRSEFFAAQHGFAAVRLEKGALVVEMIRAKDGEVIHSHSIRKP